MKLKMKRFDPCGISSSGLLGCFIVLIGRRNSGKTTLMKDLLGRLNCDLVVGVSPTDDTNQAMSSCIPKAFVFREASEDFLKNLMESQKKRWSSGRGIELCLCLDDVAWDTAFFASKTFKQLCFNGRHMHITVILAMQYALCIPPPIRAQVDLCVTMAEKMLANRKKLWEQFFGMMTFPEFCAIMDKTTNGFECLCLWNRSRSNELDTMLFWYEADIEYTKTVRTCRPAFWRLAEYYSDAGEKGARMGHSIDKVVRATNDGRTIILGADTQAGAEIDDSASLFA